MFSLTEEAKFLNLKKNFILIISEEWILTKKNKNVKNNLKLKKFNNQDVIVRNQNV